MYLTISELRQLDLLKKKSPAQRFAFMLELIEEQLEAMRAGIRYANPNMSEKELEKCLKERIWKIYSWKH
ncbi:MAG: hypothetical protein AAB213_05380 [Candidatus Omnitrophota bacterium]